MNKPKRIAITDNIIDSKSYNIPWLYQMFKYVIGSFSDIEIVKEHDIRTEDFVPQLYKALNINEKNGFSWVDIYNSNPNEESLNIIREHFENTFVIVFELHPFLQKALDKLNITYVNLRIHPIRYMDDIFLGITSNDKNIFDRIKKYQIPENYFYANASLLKMQAGVAEFSGKIKIEDDSAIFFAQTNKDNSLMNNDKMTGFLDYKDEFLEICKSYETVYYKVHPVEKNKEIINFVKSIKNVKLLYPEDINTYDILSSDKVKKCCAVSSGTLYEAKYFGKEVQYFLKQPFMFINDYQNENEYDFKNTLIPVYKTFWQPSFWADILQDYINIDKAVPCNINEIYSNKLRKILNMTWSYRDFDSVYINKRINNINNNLRYLLIDKYKFKYQKYRFLSNFVWGSKKQYYKDKKYKMKELIKNCLECKVL